ncbi:hypothetical protein AYO44_00505 [Planctomycetaceae bacterium SCGC AG-212-F19]|nr:hypothetical protein AYO44_00505 [Planctomycetaceae bacterium SCGC AG-212-F19]
MILQEPEQSQFDWQFRIFGIPVRVHPWFWIVSIMLGFSALRDNKGPEGFLYLGIWVACVFVSVLVHELGHVCAGLYFGSEGHIVLYSFGGLAVGSSNLTDRWQRIIVMFAGPAAGFILFALVAAGVWLYDPMMVTNLLRALVWLDWVRGDWPRWAERLVIDLFAINLFWGLINLLPIWPLDGGQISRELFLKYTENDGVRKSLILSIVVSVAFALNALIGWIKDEPFIPYLPKGDAFQTIFFGLFAAMSWQLLQQTARGGRAGPGRYRMEDESYERAPWERDPDWWKRG